MSLTRRGVLLTGVGALVGGCTGHAPSAAAPSAGATTSRSSSSGSSSPPGAPVLPAVTAWAPAPASSCPACKLAAVRRVERAGNGRDTALQVIDAQYGGLLTDSASVLVVTRGWRRERRPDHPGGHTYDVRLSRAGRPGGSPPSTRRTPVRPAPSLPAARRVLRSDRIVLPPAAARDVASGRVHDSVLLALLTVARTHRPSVSVIRSGHPLYVCQRPFRASAIPRYIP